VTASRPSQTTFASNRAFSLAVGLLAAALALLAAAAAAHGEAIEGVVEAPASTATPEAPAAAEAVQVPVEATPAPPPTPVPEAPVAEEPSGAVSVPSATEPVEAVHSSPPSPVAAAVERTTKLVESAGYDSAEQIGRTADRLRSVPADPVRQLADPTRQLGDAVARQAQAAVPHLAQATVEGAADGPLLAIEGLARDALAEVESATIGGLLTIGWSPAPAAGPGGAETVAAAGAFDRLGNRGGEAQLAKAPAAGALLARGAGDPAPSDIPPPAPGSPGAVASGSGGPIFVPIAALLALLALAAPAVLRRLGRAPDFRPPIPFVCALERPG